MNAGRFIQKMDQVGHAISTNQVYPQRNRLHWASIHRLRVTDKDQ
jgi:hypothetical protein